MRVVIVGGGIAGLTLANALQHADIDYVLLERHSVIDPQVGASIGLLPNGSRILDQLSCYDEILERTSPTHLGRYQKADGSLLKDTTHILRLLATRSGYWTCFLDRRDVLRALADHVVEKHRIHLNKRVSRVEDGSEGVRVHCTDGTSYHGDLVVGADGVNSIIRKEMWHLADEAGEGQRFAKDKHAMFAEYKCYFGISNPVAGLDVGKLIITHDYDRAFVGVTGKEGRIYCFAFAKMDRRYEGHEIPKFTQADMEHFLDEHGDLPVLGDKIKLRDLSDTKVSGSLIALEEAQYDHWSYGRIACVGDAIHKMTPSFGAGGSSAIESVAVLASLLNTLNTTPEARSPSLPAMRELLERYEEQRSLRMNKVLEMAGALTRMQAVRGKIEYFISHYALPNSGDIMVDFYAEFMVGSPLLEYLPPPQRSLDATMPFNPEHGWGHEENKFRRAGFALPILLLSILASFQTAATHHSSVSLLVSKASVIDFCSMYGFWLVESARRNNRLTFAQMPLLFGLAARYAGMAVVTPVYFFLLYVLSPIDKFKAADHRLTNLAYTRTVLPLVLLLAPLQVYLAVRCQNTADDRQWTWLASPFPLWITITQWLLARFVMQDTVLADSRDNPQRDAWVVRWTAAALGSISAAFYLGSHFIAVTPSPAGFWSDMTCASTAGLLWLVYTMKDLKRAGMIEQSWLSLLGSMMLSMICVGPMATFAAGWLFRENALLHRRHKAALVQGWFEKRQRQLRAARNSCSNEGPGASTDGSLDKSHSMADSCRMH